ncbi:MAG: hypothetical protein MUE51_01795 [Thermoleophilia bacterium]|nr:hypothetical protein [Thermoleophilia bacterium]
MGLATGLWPLYIAAAVLYGVLAGTTFFNVDEGRKVIAARRGTGEAEAPAPAPVLLTDPLVRARYAEARDEEARIRAALQKSPIPLPEVEVEMAGLMDDVRHLCEQAEVVTGYLRTVDRERLAARLAAVERDRAAAGPDLEATLAETATALAQQIQTVDEMEDHTSRFHARMTQLVSTMGAIRAQVVRLQVQGQPDASERVRGQLAGARELLAGINAGMDEVAERAQETPG